MAQEAGKEAEQKPEQKAGQESGQEAGQEAEQKAGQWNPVIRLSVCLAHCSLFGFLAICYWRHLNLGQCDA